MGHILVYKLTSYMGHLVWREISARFSRRVCSPRKVYTTEKPEIRTIQPLDVGYEGLQIPSDPIFAFSDGIERLARAGLPLLKHRNGVKINQLL
jgi:hypothetical protein